MSNAILIRGASDATALAPEVGFSVKAVARVITRLCLWSTRYSAISVANCLPCPKGRWSDVIQPYYSKDPSSVCKLCPMGQYGEILEKIQ